LELKVDGNANQNLFLSGNYAPLQSEDDFDLEVVGEWPRAMAGRLLRIGPNPQFPAPDHFWFHGDGMAHAFEVLEGRVRYRNRFVRTPKFLAEAHLGRALRPGEAEALGVQSAVANTNIIRHGGRVFALEEMNPPFAMTEDLDSLGFADTGGAVTAHPKIDPETGELVFFAYASGGPASRMIDIGVISADGGSIHRERIEAPYSSMVHDGFLTRNHLILPILPLAADLGRAAQGGPFYAWDASLPSCLAVIDRRMGVSSLRWFDVEPGYVFHTLNAYEDNGCIWADTFLFETAPLFPDVNGGVTENRGALLGRWTLDLDSGRTSWTVLDDRPGEFPRMDERWLGRKHRHGWFAGQVTAPGSVWFDSLRHVDLVTGQAAEWILPPGDAISEPVFVPSGPSEGEGWILAVAYRGLETTSDLLVFDARDVGNGPRARARLPRRVPFGFHGNWFDAHR
jgi:carotenoid cleavage dioxygenase